MDFIELCSFYMSDFMHIGKGMLKLQRMTKWDFFETRCSLTVNNYRYALDSFFIYVVLQCLQLLRLLVIFLCFVEMVFE